MNPRFREDKATQAVALFLKLRGGNMSHLKLMKLLYLAEREALLRWGRPITFDSCVSMPFGPVLSQTLNLINGYSEQEHWEKFISIPSNNEVHLLEDPGNDKLSDAEDLLIREVFEKYGAMSRWEVRDITHNLAEWQDPMGSSIRIDYRDILRTSDKTDAEIEAILQEIENIGIIDSLEH